MPSDFFKLIILAAVTGFLIYKLYITLGQKVGFEPSSESKSVNSPVTPETVSEVPDVPEAISALPEAVQAAIREIQQFDPSFTLKSFLSGATQAFEIIIDSFAKNDLKTLKDLLAPDVFDEFKASIEEREKHGEVLETTLVKFESVDLTDGEIKDQKALLTVTFQTEQIHITRDKKGEIIDGNPQQIEQLIDTWVFERSLSSRNPNWILVKTTV
ncbi:MAG: Tim44/TimA family putative adaptor protein [Janthinobacterium lividum]